MKTIGLRGVRFTFLLLVAAAAFVVPLQSVLAELPIAMQQTAGEGTEAAAKSEEAGINGVEIVFGVIAGLAIFLFGVEQLAKALTSVSGDRMKNILSRFTSNRFAGLATGTAVTAALDSSSVTIIMTIALVSAGVLTFAQSLAVILGANIGTTLGGQIIAFDVMKYAPVLLLGGLLLHFLGRSPRAKQWGIVILAAGMVFFGLEYIGTVMEPFEAYQPFRNLMQEVAGNPIKGALIGAAFTALIQSSSGTMAIVITLATNGLIPLEAGIHLMLGAEIGTCLDTVVATVRRSRAAVRTGVFHLVFNLVTVAIGLVLARHIASAGAWLAGGSENVGRQIANAHVLFNAGGALLFLPFLQFFTRVLNRTVLPERDVPSTAVPAAA